MRGKLKKLSLGTLLGVFVFISLFGSLVATRPAKAAMFTVSDLLVEKTLTEWDLTFFKQATAKLYKEPIEEKIKVAMLSAVMRMVTYFVQKMAYDFAVYTASGGKGQGALVYQGGFKDYMKNVGDHAVGTAIDAIGEPFGLDLCSPGNFGDEIMLRLGIRAKFCDPETGEGGPQGICKPHCTLSQFLNNWEQVGTSQYWERQAENFNASLEPTETDFGFYLEGSRRVEMIRDKAIAAAELDRVEGESFKSVTELITGDVKTPGTIIRKTNEDQSASEQAKQSKVDVNATLATGIAELPMFGVSVFLNTFLATTFKNFFQNGTLFGYCVTGNCGDESEDDDLLYNDYSQGPSVGRAGAEEFYRNVLLDVNIGEIEEYNILSQFTTCHREGNSTHNCVMDSDFSKAFNQNEFGIYMTIREAVEAGYLHSNWPILGPDDLRNKSERCFEGKAYCYNNIKKLRQARILPTGFEIAAAEYGSTDKDEDSEATLGKFLDNFDNENSKYYHLIDPDWLLKVPQARCDLLAYGPYISGSGSNTRVQECLDLKSCVKENDDGTCMAYGYCTREGNIWRFDLDTCDPQYHTCKSFTNQTTKESAAYIYRTVDSEGCDADNAGCMEYSFVKAITDNGKQAGWAYYESGENLSSKFFLPNVETCPSGSDGCTLFKTVESDEGVYLRKAPLVKTLFSAVLPIPGGSSSGEIAEADRFTSCYLYPATSQGGQSRVPKTKAELNDLNNFLADRGLTEYCSNYAQVCLPEEEGCNLYHPITYPGLSIPAKFTPYEIINSQIVWNDQCDQSCVGYAAYQEMPSRYANGSAIEYIIPSSGQTCSHPGCSAFTNLSTAQGQTEDVEYYSYLRPCILPDNQRNDGVTRQKNFITYEGSDLEGYQIKTYILEEDLTGETADGLSGAPKYYYRTQAELNKYLEICNENVYFGGENSTGYFEGEFNGDYLSSEDCRQFNDAEGNAYYRLLSKTIVVSDKCTPYRLNSTELYIEESISNNSACEALQLGGIWTNVDDDTETGDANGKECGVCFQNGEYRDGFCYYDGLPVGVSTNAGSSKVCPASENTCRTYKGNAGNNIEEIFLDGFELQDSDEAKKNWFASNDDRINISNQSTQSGGQSLLFTGSGYVYKELKQGEYDIEEGETYQLSFWAKGSVGTINVSLAGSGEQVIDSVSVSGEWQQYIIGPFITENGNDGRLPDVVSLRFENSSGSGNILLYLDNVRLVKVRDLLNLVKNSLSVPLVCDSNPNDELPGEALGCAAYNFESLGEKSEIYLKNFSYLCREDAVGCTKFVDTQNLDSDTPVAYNIYLENSSTSTLRELSLRLDGKTYSCMAPIGSPGCYINNPKKSISGYGENQIKGANTWPSGTTVVFDKSTIYYEGYSRKVDKQDDPTPGNEAEYQYLYLVANEDATCNSVDRGCSAVAMITPNEEDALVGFEEQSLKLNDPAQYDEILCTAGEVGCAYFTDRDSRNYYFRDPALIGGKTCVYKKDVDYQIHAGMNVKVDGWFKEEVGLCGTQTEYNNNKLRILLENPEYCLSDDDCSGNKICVGKEEVPCYENIKETYVASDGGYLGIWSSGLSQYEGYVGECPAEQHGCTRFLDHYDQENVDAAGEVTRPTSYYFIVNDNFYTQKSECSSGEVSIKKGCILLDQDDNPNKLYNTDATYGLSKSQENALVKPVTTGIKDANIIMKARQDRECAEWLFCAVQGDIDSATGEGKCEQLGVCYKAASNASGCANNGDITGYQEGAGRTMVINTDNKNYAKKFLPNNQTIMNYRYRDTDWDGFEFSGYSFYSDPIAPYKKDTQDDESLEGVNLDGKNLTEIYSEIASLSSYVGDSFSKYIDCRVYPTADSPYPTSVFSEENNSIVKRSPYQNVNVFNNELKAAENECYYRKISYGNGAKTFYVSESELDDDGLPEGICLSSEDDEEEKGCTTDKDCCTDDLSDLECRERGFTCGKLDKEVVEAMGEDGFCVEHDYRMTNGTDLDHNVGNDQYGCITWLPVYNIPGGRNTATDPDRGNEYTPTPANIDENRYICIGNRPILKDSVREKIVNLGGGIGLYGSYQIKFYSPDNQNFMNDFNSTHNDTPVYPYSSYTNGDEYSYGRINDEKYEVRAIAREVDEPIASFYLRYPDDTSKMVNAIFYPFPSEYDISRARFTWDSGADAAATWINKFTIHADKERESHYIPFIDDYKTSYLGEGTSFLSEGTGDVHLKDIERIDVIIGEHDDMEDVLPGTVMFVTEDILTYENDDEDYYNFENFKIIESNDVESNYVNKFYKNEEGEDNKWWGWMMIAHYDEEGNFADSSNEGFNQFVHTEEGGDEIQDTDHYTAAGVKIEFDSDDTLKGFHIMGADGGLPLEISFVFVIYLNEGRCESVVKVWDANAGGKVNYGALAESEESLYFGGDYARERTDDWQDWGLVQAGWSHSVNGAIWTFPFEKEDLWGDSFKDWFKGGIPMNEPDNSPDYYFGGYDCVDNYNWSVCKGLVPQRFGKIYGIWTWQGGDEKWVEETGSLDAYDIDYVSNDTVVYPVEVKGPIFARKGGGEYVMEWGANVDSETGRGKFSLWRGTNDEKFLAYPGVDYSQGYYSDGNVVGEPWTNVHGDLSLIGGAGVHLGFYMEANPQQMPINKMVIDYDVNEPVEKGQFYKNYEKECESADLGNCVKKYYEISKYYRCLVPVNQMVIPASRSKSPAELTGSDVSDLYLYEPRGQFHLVEVEIVANPDKELKERSGSGIPYIEISEEQALYELELQGGTADKQLVCVYYPKVFVKDSWDACTGNCREFTDYGYADGYGCYDDNCDLEKDLADWATNWVEGGRIIIKPEFITKEGHTGSQNDPEDWDYLEDFYESD